jgi:cobyrinic acid a,c-diamide synthase
MISLKKLMQTGPQVIAEAGGRLYLSRKRQTES